MSRRTVAAVGASVLACVVLVTTGCGGGGDEAARAATVARAYLAAEGPAVCGFLSARELAAFASDDAPGIEACRNAKRLQQGDTVADAVESRGDTRLAGVVVDGGGARAEALDAMGRSVEIDLVREGDEWRVDADPDEVADDAALVGSRISATESALFDALLFGPAPGDDAALAAALRLTRGYVRLVAEDGALAASDRARKLGWALRLTADGSCDPCRAILARARVAAG